MPSVVIRIPAASSTRALAHFEALLEFETDCWDVHFAISDNRQDFVLVDVRGANLFDKGHIAGAINIPHSKLSEAALSDIPTDTLIVVYCVYSHCNATEKRLFGLLVLADQ